MKGLIYALVKIGYDGPIECEPFDQELLRKTVRPPRRPGFKTTTVRRHQLYLMQAIPEIGGMRARLLLDRFGSPARIAEASVDALRSVDGIGEVAAKRIYRVFHDSGGDV